LSIRWAEAGKQSYIQCVFSVTTRLSFGSYSLFFRWSSDIRKLSLCETCLKMNLTQISTQMDVEKGVGPELYSAATLTPSYLEEGRRSSSRSAGLARAESEDEGQSFRRSIRCQWFG
jgi:hypothetical protein